MAALSDYLETALLNHVLRGNAGGATFSQPANTYVALFTTATSDTVTSGGTGQGEVSTAGTGYARQVFTATNPPSSGQVSNTADINFPTAAAGWGTVTHCALFDAVTGGNCLMHASLATPKSVNLGDSFRFLATTFVAGLAAFAFIIGTLGETLLRVI